MSVEKHLAVHGTREFLKGAIQAAGNGASVAGVLGAGATATVGGPMVVAAAAAALPVVATLAVVGGLSYCWYRAFND